MFLIFPVRWRSSPQRKHACKATPISIRCEQSSEDGSGLDAWLGRFAMVGFAAAITVEVATGKGLLEVWYGDQDMPDSVDMISNPYYVN